MPENKADATTDPSKVAGRVFATSRKGFDPDEVRTYLGQLSGELASLRAERDRLAGQVAEAEAQAEAQVAAEPTAPAEPAPAPASADLDEDQLTAALGAETVRVLATARHSAAEIRSKAEETAARMLREASDDAASRRSSAEESSNALRAEADAYAAMIRAEADSHGLDVRAKADAHAAEAISSADAAAAATIEAADAAAESTRTAAEALAAEVTLEAETTTTAMMAEAEAESTRLRAEAASLLEVRSAEAEAEAARIRAEADAVLAAAAVTAAEQIEAAKAEGRELVTEAQQVRERMLKDLARRRKAARQQLEQLRAGRDRLLDAFDVVRRSTDEATGELLVSLPEARVAAQDAGRRAEAESEATVAELEAELGVLRPAAPAPSIGAEPTSEELIDLEVELGPLPAEAVAAPAAEAVEVIVIEEVETADGVEVDEIDVVGVIEADGSVEVVIESIEAIETAGAIETTGAIEATEAIAVVDLPGDAIADVGSGADDEADGKDALADDSEPPADVDELFARLRAAREQADAGAGSKDLVDDSALEVGDEDDEIAPVEVGTVSLLEQRDGVTDEIEHRLARRLKRVMADEQNAVLDAVRRSRKLPPAGEVLPSTAEHIRTYAVAAVDDLMDAAKAGAAFQGSDSAGGSVSADATAQTLAGELVGLIRPRIEHCFDEVDEDEDELTGLIRSVYREWKTQRIAEVVRHHVLLAFSQGQFAAVPSGSRLQWVIDDGGTPCPDAEDNALAGAVAKGEAFPTGHCYPPAHPGCRCLVVVAPH